METNKIKKYQKDDVIRIIEEKLKKNKRITEEELLELINNSEGDRLEFKQSINDVRGITQTLSAFSNNKGGIVAVGVNDKEHDNKRVIGTKVGYQSIENIVTCANDQTEPKLYPVIKSFKVIDKNIVLIYISESDHKPVSAFKRFYKRIGNVSKQLDRNEYERLMLERRGISFDELINEPATMNDIDMEKVKAYVKKRSELKVVKEPSLKPGKILKNVGVTKKINKKLFLKNSALLFFGKEPSKFIPHSEMKLARFKGNSMVEFIDSVDLKSTLPDMIDEAEKFIRRNTRTATKIVGFKQQNIAEYPYPAVREAIVNAVAHRDYGFKGTAIRIMIFDDRIEVESPGKLPNGVTLKNLEGSHVLRNETIANLLYDIGYIEKWGTGIRRMKELMKSYGLKDPVFEQKDSFFKVTFYGPGKDILELTKSEDVDLKSKGLNERQIEALRLMVNDGKKFTNREYRDKFAVGNKTAADDLNKLVKQKLIRSSGKGRSIRYFFSNYTISDEATRLSTRLENGN